MKFLRTFLTLVLISLIYVACNEKTEEDKLIDSLIAKMTIEEKIGQMNQYSYSEYLTGPEGKQVNMVDEVKNGRVGSILNLIGAEETRKMQKVAVEESRMGIPILYGLDVIHGYKTLFPVPLAEAASWDLEAIENSARISAIEASAAGVHWTFAPMLDIARDARWGRVMEGAGEDPYYGSLVGVARIKGFQGSDLSENNTILACAKHYVAYGAALGGRDYNTVDISERTLYEIYLPPFVAANDAGVGTFMTAFNELNGIPCTGNSFILKDMLKGEWNFEGFVVSDWSSIREMINHGNVKDLAEAGELAVNSGVDMDMMSYAYLEHLKKSVEDGAVNIKLIDDAVRRILIMKKELGLFDDPYKYCNEEKEKELLLHPDHLKATRDMARKSIVLLKNENNILPLDKKIKTIAVIGPLADNKDDPMGTWSALGEAVNTVTLLEGIQNAVSKDTRVLYSVGCKINDGSTDMISEAVQLARRADVVIAAVGESKMMSGEALCRSEIGLPGKQLELIKALERTGTPVIVTLMNGRPLAIPWMSENMEVILETWLLGSQTGNAISDVLFGDYNPSGKLPVSFPYSSGQLPIFYNTKNTGRPIIESQRYTSKYLDVPNTALYPFGYGLSYTSFKYGPVKLSAGEILPDGNLGVSTTITNTGKYSGKEVVQLYIRDMVASVTRPVKELKAFEMISLEPGQSKEVTFTLSESDLSFYNQNMVFVAEPGEFKVFIGGNSRDVNEAVITLLK